jgi:diketogulonate reductase-like aldo/keto reductase
MKTICGKRLLSPHRLEENRGVVNVKLAPEELREIDEAASEIDVQGARYPEKLEALTGK